MVQSKSRDLKLLLTWKRKERTAAEATVSQNGKLEKKRAKWEGKIGNPIPSIFVSLRASTIFVSSSKSTKQRR